MGRTTQTKLEKLFLEKIREESHDANSWFFKAYYVPTRVKYIPAEGGKIVSRFVIDVTIFRLDKWGTIGQMVSGYKPTRRHVHIVNKSIRNSFYNRIKFWVEVFSCGSFPPVVEIRNIKWDVK